MFIPRSNQSPNFADELVYEIQSRIDRSAFSKGKKSQALTIGLEQEFFLRSPAGEPCTHEQSQYFLQILANQPNWKVQAVGDTNLGKMITRVSIDDDKSGFVAVKYDHHPHLMEIAFGFYSDLHNLFLTVKNIIHTIQSVALDTKLVVDLEPNLALNPLDPRLLSELYEMSKLRYYRSKLLQKRGLASSHPTCNYASVIASTQVHIGGLRWWESDDIIQKLYLLEPTILPFAFADHDDARQIVKTRWGGYETVFLGFPLVGFPELSSWSITNWADALAKSPLAGGPLDEWSGLTLHAFNRLPEDNWNTFFTAVRDLQIIKPRPFGTIEFRADCSQTSPEAICAVVALRFAACLGLQTLEAQNGSFIESRKNWWDQVHEGPSKIDVQFLLQLIKVLKIRGRGEEQYLNRYLEHA